MINSLPSLIPSAIHTPHIISPPHSHNTASAIAIALNLQPHAMQNTHRLSISSHSRYHNAPPQPSKPPPHIPALQAHHPSSPPHPTMSRLPRLSSDEGDAARGAPSVSSEEPSHVTRCACGCGSAPVETGDHDDERRTGASSRRSASWRTAYARPATGTGGGRTSASASGARCARTTAPTVMRGRTFPMTMPAHGRTAGVRREWPPSATWSSACASGSRCGTVATRS